MCGVQEGSADPTDGGKLARRGELSREMGRRLPGRENGTWGGLGNAAVW